jgi:hypothetical protein
MAETFDLATAFREICERITALEKQVATLTAKQPAAPTKAVLNGAAEKGSPPLLDRRELARLAGVHPQTIFRWMKYGCRVAGRLVYLETERVGGRWRSDEKRLRAFVQRCKTESFREARMG